MLNDAAGRCSDPVSYTHLDVYKRQGIGCAARRDHADRHVFAWSAAQHQLHGQRLVTKSMCHIQVINGDRLPLEAEIALMNAPIQQLKSHKCPQVIDLTPIVIADVGNVNVRPIDRDAKVILQRK